jgi:hypothetical protein
VQLPPVQGGPVVVPPPVIVETPRPTVPGPQEVFWGRWQEIASMAPRLGRIEDPDVEVATYYAPYAITRLKNSALVMPKEGTAAFKLLSGEAIMTNALGDRAASIESGQLNMDFANRTFTTSLMVKAGVDQADVIGSGIITDKGMLYEDTRSQTTIRGYLGGANAEQAGYIFKNYANPGTIVSGATLWGR